MNFFSVYVISYVFLAALATETTFFAHKFNMMRLVVVLFVALCLYRFLAQLLARSAMPYRQTRLT